MLEIKIKSLQCRRKPHRKFCHHRPTTINQQRGHASNRVVANTVTFLWILLALVSFLSFRQEGLVCAGDDNYAAQADDGNVNNDDVAEAANGDDAAAAEESNDDAAAAAETTDDNNSGSSAYENEQKQYQDTDDDTFHWNQNIGFDGVSVMPLSCIN